MEKGVKDKISLLLVCFEEAAWENVRLKGT